MDTSYALKLITAGAILAFIMPYITMIVLAFLLYIDARKSMYTIYLEKATDKILALFPEKVRFFLESFILLPKKDQQPQSDDFSMTHVPLYNVPLYNVPLYNPTGK